MADIKVTKEKGLTKIESVTKENGKIKKYEDMIAKNGKKIKYGGFNV